MVRLPIEMEYNIEKRRWEFVCTRPDGMMAATYVTQDMIDTVPTQLLFYTLIRIGWTWREEYDKAEEPQR